MSGAAGEWEEKFHSGKQRKYWKNKATGKTTWSEPFVKTPSGDVVKFSATSTSSATSESSSSNMEEEWEEKFSVQHKKKYWKNKTTGKTSWKEPSPPPQSAASVTEPGGLAGSLKKSASTLKAERAVSCTADTTETEEVEWEWEEKFHAAKNRKYWKNKKTGKSTWTEPPKTFSSTASSQQDTEVSPWGEQWKESFSAVKNKKYWKNLTTGKSQWTEPPRVTVTKSSVTCTAVDESSSAAHWEPLQNAEQFNNLKAKHSELSDQYNTIKGKYIDLESLLTESRREVEELKHVGESSSSELESKLQEKEEQIEHLTSWCALYKKNHEEAEERFQEVNSKEKLSAADIASLQEQHEASVRKLNAELEINIIREKTKGESSLLEVTRELNELKLRNDSLEVKCQLLAEEKDEISLKLTSVNDAKSSIESNNSDKDSIYKEISARNEQLLDEVTDLENAIKDLKSQGSNSAILLEEYKQNSVDMNAKFAEEKVKLTLDLEDKTEKLKSLEDKCDDLEANNHKLTIERDLLKRLNEEADSRQVTRQEANEETVATIEDVKLEFSNKIRRLNAEIEIKLLEERAVGEKNELAIRREYNDLKTQHEYLNSRYKSLAEEKKMFDTEINHAKQQIKELCEEKDKLMETLHFTQKLTAEKSNAAPPPPPISYVSTNEKNLEKIKRYEIEIDELQVKFQEQCEQITTQRDNYKKELHSMEADKSNWEATLEEKDNAYNKLMAESQMYKNKYEESEIRFHVWENESESKGKIWTQSMKELQMLHESQTRKLKVEFEIQILEERSKGEQKLFATVSKLNSLKVTLSQMEAEANIKYDLLRGEKEDIEHALALLKEKETSTSVPLHHPTPQKRSARLTNSEADILKTQLFSIIQKFDGGDQHSTPPDSPPPDYGLDVVYDDDDTPPNSPPPSDDEGDSD
jgi:chromosome segregation ATPase